MGGFFISWRKRARRLRASRVRFEGHGPAGPSLPNRPFAGRAADSAPKAHTAKRELSEQSFRQWAACHESEKRSHTGPFFGWLNAALQPYPDTVNLKARVHLRDGFIRPFIELFALVGHGDHPAEGGRCIRLTIGLRAPAGQNAHPRHKVDEEPGEYRWAIVMSGNAVVHIDALELNRPPTGKAEKTAPMREAFEGQISRHAGVAAPGRTFSSPPIAQR